MLQLLDFDPRGSCEPRHCVILDKLHLPDFDPRGSCEPRREIGARRTQIENISIHEALASLDPDIILLGLHNRNFDPRGSCEPRRGGEAEYRQYGNISIHEALASLDLEEIDERQNMVISIHEALASLDQKGGNMMVDGKFRSTRLLRASTVERGMAIEVVQISIHEALASLDKSGLYKIRQFSYFDPRGSCEPRHRLFQPLKARFRFRSTRLLRASTSAE